MLGGVICDHGTSYTCSLVPQYSATSREGVPLGVAICCSMRDFAPKMDTSPPPGEMATSLASKWLLSAGLPTGRRKPPCRRPPRAQHPLRRNVQITALKKVAKCDRSYFPAMEMPDPLSNAAALPLSATPWTKIRIEALTFKRSQVDCGQFAAPFLRDANVAHSDTRVVASCSPGVPCFIPSGIHMVNDLPSLMVWLAFFPELDGTPGRRSPPFRLLRVFLPRKIDV